jgi:hypothetical protein
MQEKRDHPMEQPDLTLRLLVSEINGTGAERLILFASLQAWTARPRGPRPEFVVLCRDESGLPPPWMTRSAVTRQDVTWLVTLLEAAGFPWRTPRAAPNPGRGPSRGRQRIELEVRMEGRVKSLELVLQHAGFSGPDAWSVRAVLDRLGELAEAAGRPAVRAVLGALAVDSSAAGERGWPLADLHALENPWAIDPLPESRGPDQRPVG